MDIQQIVDDIYALNRHLQAFEKKYALSSADFYEMFAQGELDNGEFEQTRDFVEWAGFTTSTSHRTLNTIVFLRLDCASMNRICPSLSERLRSYW